jgi:hypothetical protein
MAALAPTPNTAIVREFSGIMAKDDLLIDLKPSAAGAGLQPLICGVEILAEDR